MLQGILIILLLLFAWYYMRRTTSIPAAGRSWQVVGKYENAQSAAELADRVHSQIIVFFKYLKKKYHIDETDDFIAGEYESHSAVVNNPNDTYKMVDFLLDNYNPDVIYENDPRFSMETSYTINKGESMHMCLRNKDDVNTLVDYETLLFTWLHEISHIANYNGWHHEPPFWVVFKFILQEAEAAGIYTPIDYSKTPVVFCGLDIPYNPYYDKSLPNLI